MGALLDPLLVDKYGGILVEWHLYGVLDDEMPRRAYTLSKDNITDVFERRVSVAYVERICTVSFEMEISALRVITGHACIRRYLRM